MTESRNQNKLLDKSVMKHFPKIELHRHLEGTFPVEKLYELSVKNNLGRPHDFEEFKREVQFPSDAGPDFLTFLTKFKNDWYRSTDDVSYISYHSVKELAREGIFYIELRFSPEHFSLENDFDRQVVSKLIIEAGNKAAQEIGVQIRYLLTFNRSKQSPEEMVALYDLLKKAQLPGVVGIDLAGDEINYPPEMFRDFFRLINKDGMYRSTIHAGEVTPAQQIWEAIENLGASRIGHGTSAVKDPKLQDYLKERFVALEQCITSNYQTGSWVDEKNHPIGRLYRQGVPVTLNSDDPFIQNTDLTDDYIKAANYFDFSLQDFINLNLTALKASFLTNGEKERLGCEYLQEIEQFKKKFFLE